MKISSLKRGLICLTLLLSTSSVTYAETGGKNCGALNDLGDRIGADVVGACASNEVVFDRQGAASLMTTKGMYALPPNRNYPMMFTNGSATWLFGPADAQHPNHFWVRLNTGEKFDWEKDADARNLVATPFRGTPVFQPPAFTDPSDLIIKAANLACEHTYKEVCKAINHSNIQDGSSILALNLSLKYTTVDQVAAILVHEGTHLVDFGHKNADWTNFCYQTENNAYTHEAQFWQSSYPDSIYPHRNIVANNVNVDGTLDSLTQNYKTTGINVRLNPDSYMITCRGK